MGSDKLLAILKKTSKDFRTFSNRSNTCKSIATNAHYYIGKNNENIRRKPSGKVIGIVRAKLGTTAPNFLFMDKPPSRAS